MECLKAGATNYVLKHQLERLVPAIKRALRENETKLRMLIEHTMGLFYSRAPDHKLTYVSPQSRIF